MASNQYNNHLCFLSETCNLRSAQINKVSAVLSSANQNICIHEACILTGLYAHSKQILDKFKLVPVQTISEAFSKCGLEQLNIIKSRLNLRYIKLAVDITHEAYYGEIIKGDVYISNQIPQDAPAATGSHQYLTISATSHNCRLILFNLLLQPGYIIEDIIPQVLDKIREHIEIKQVTFDRGFHSKALIYELEIRNLKYMIFLRKTKSNRKKLNMLKSGESQSEIEEIVFYKNQEKYSCKAKKVYIKEFRYDETEQYYDWVFATNLSFASIRHTITCYRNRWGIETVFRVLNQQFRIKTNSKHPSVRAMCCFFSMIFYNLWQLAKCFISSEIHAKSFFETIRYGFKCKFQLKYKFEDDILKLFNLT
jgi:hypothetical protein